MQLKSLVRLSLAFVTASLISATMVLAQDGGMAPPPSRSPENTPMPSGEPNMSNTSAEVFLRNVFESDVTQVQMSQLAQQKSESDDVKQFSEQMVKVHTKLDDQLTPMAKQMGVEKPKGPSKKCKKELEKLQSLSGESFDTEYLQAMANEQQDAIKRFDKESKDSLNPPAQEAAKADGPVLEQNYQVLEQIAQAHNVNLQEQAKK
jgi:putative membrane protein